MKLNLLDLPPEVLMQISSFVADEDLQTLATSCKKLFTIALQSAIDRTRTHIPSNQAEAIDTLVYQYNIVLRKTEHLQQANAILDAVTMAIHYPSNHQASNSSVNAALETLSWLLSDPSLGWAHYAFFTLAAEANTRGAIKARSNPAFVTILSKLVAANLNNKIIPQRFLAPMLGNHEELQTQIHKLEDLNKEIIKLNNKSATIDKKLNAEKTPQSPSKYALKNKKQTAQQATMKKTLADITLQLRRLTKQSEIQTKQWIVTARESLEAHIANRESSSYRHSTWLLMNVSAIHHAEKMNNPTADDIIAYAFNEIIARTNRIIGTLAIYYHNEAHKRGIALTESTQTNFNQRHPNCAKPLPAKISTVKTDIILRKRSGKSPAEISSTAEATCPTGAIKPLPEKRSDSKKSKFSSFKHIITKTFS